ncbi:hypothetical protein GLYMA_16G110650v4 [Glycine max]|nr:hypothetical protein GLYMA_16G110650v4 [Glycine max]KAH1150965.1 hypothetical protein GYH30_044795 [Glycine max]
MWEMLIENLLSQVKSMSFFRVPCIANLKPSGKYVVEDVHKGIIRPIENPIKKTAHIQILG